MNLFEQTFKKHVKLVNEALNGGKVHADIGSPLYGELEHYHPETLNFLLSDQFQKNVTPQKFQNFKNKWNAAKNKLNVAMSKPGTTDVTVASDELYSVYESLTDDFGIPEQMSQHILSAGQGGTPKEWENDIQKFYRFWGMDE